MGNSRRWNISSDAQKESLRIFGPNLPAFLDLAGNPVDRIVGEVFWRRALPGAKIHDERAMNMFVLFSCDVTIRIQDAEKLIHRLCG